MTEPCTTVDPTRVEPQEVTLVFVDYIRKLSKQDRKYLQVVLATLTETECSTTEEEECLTTVAEILFGGRVKVVPYELIDPKDAPERSKYAVHTGATIRQFRDARGWTQIELASRSRLTQAHISKLESGEQSPNAKTRERLAKAFGIEPRELDIDRE